MAENSVLNIPGSISPTTLDAPLDARTRIDRISDVYDVQYPYVGMEIYVLAEKKKIRVLSLGEKMVNGVTIPKSTISSWQWVEDNSIAVDHTHNQYITQQQLSEAHYTKTDIDRLFSDVYRIMGGGNNAIVMLSVLSEWSGTVSGSGIYTKGENVTISATANNGYRFVKWSDNNTNPTRVITVNATVSLQAIFEIIPAYLVSLSVNNPSYGIVSGGGKFTEGSSVIITAIANEGYEFVKWSDGDTNATRTIVVLSNTTLEAEFKANSPVTDSQTSAMPLVFPYIFS